MVDPEYVALRREAEAKLLEWARFYRDLLNQRGLPLDEAAATVGEIVDEAARRRGWESV